MNKQELQARLMKTFLAELEDHVAVLNDALLRIEQTDAEGGRAEPLRSAFRAAHSLKGAARSVGQETLEAVCQHVETILASKQRPGVVFERGLFQLLYETTDAIESLGKVLAEAAPADRSELLLRDLTRRLEVTIVGNPLGDYVTAPDGRPARDRRPPSAALGRLKERAPPDPEAEGRPESRLRHVGSLSGQVRVDGERLDRLMALSGELQIARMQSRQELAMVEDVKSALYACRAEWSRHGPLIAGLATSAAGLNARSIAAHRAADRRTRLALRALAGMGESLERLEQDVECLRARLAMSRKILDQAAMPLERSIRQLRMLPFQQACDGLPRTVRDLAVASGRQIHLSIEGGDLELDRGTLEALRAPLLHLVRNAIDHGIELPAERLAAGKGAEGQIRVSATAQGNRAQIRVADDGRGLDLAAVAEQGRAQGLAVPEAPEAMVDLIFAPGVSTAGSVTALSGRGVGLDVVRTTVMALRGSVAVRSTVGEGTQFDISVPLTTSVFPALLMRAGRTVFAIDVDSVLRVLPVSPGDPLWVDNRQVLMIDERQVPVLPLAQLLELKESGPPGLEETRPMAVVVNNGTREAAFLVQQVIGNEEVVAKQLGDRLNGLRFIAGASALPDGDLALILNPAELLAAATNVSATKAALQAPAGDRERRRRRILVVEDSMTTRMLEVSVLQAAGYDVMSAVDGVDAWSLIEAGDIDLIVSDLEMPRMDGFALTETVRSTPATRDIPVILLTARGADQDKLKGLQAGADAYLVKSAFDQEVLLETIQRLLP